MLFNKYLVITIAILGITVVIMFKKWQHAEGQVTQLTDYVKVKDAETEHYKNQYGRQVAKTDALQIDFDTFKKISSDKDLEWIQQFEGVKKSLKNLEVTTQVNAKAVADFKLTGTDTTIMVDGKSTPGFNFGVDDQWLKVEGIVLPETKYVQALVEVNVPIEGVLYWQRKKILGLRIGKKTWKSEFTSPNPHVTIMNNNQILIRRQ